MADRLTAAERRDCWKLAAVYAEHAREAGACKRGLETFCTSVEMANTIAAVAEFEAAGRELARLYREAGQGAETARIAPLMTAAHARWDAAKSDYDAAVMVYKEATGSMRPSEGSA